MHASGKEWYRRSRGRQGTRIKIDAKMTDLARETEGHMRVSSSVNLNEEEWHEMCGEIIDAEKFIEQHQKWTPIM